MYSKLPSTCFIGKAKEVHFYKLVKAVSKVLRCKNPIQILNELITDKNMNKFSSCAVQQEDYKHE